MAFSKWDPISPEEWFSSIRTVICLYRSSAILKSFRYRVTGASRDTRPASASCITATVV